MMNHKTEARRVLAVRALVREKCEAGMAGVVAARARVPESYLRTWVSDPLYDNGTRPTWMSAASLVDLQDAVADHVTMPARLSDDCHEIDTRGTDEDGHEVQSTGAYRRGGYTGE